MKPQEIVKKSGLCIKIMPSLSKLGRALLIYFYLFLKSFLNIPLTLRISRSLVAIYFMLRCERR